MTMMTSTVVRIEVVCNICGNDSLLVTIDPAIEKDIVHLIIAKGWVVVTKNENDVKHICPKCTGVYEDVKKLIG